jgi:hypothetical protein
MTWTRDGIGRSFYLFYSFIIIILLYSLCFPFYGLDPFWKYFYLFFYHCLVLAPSDCGREREEGMGGSSTSFGLELSFLTTPSYLVEEDDEEEQEEEDEVKCSL